MSHEIDEIEVAPAWIAAVRRRAAREDVARVAQELLGQVRAWLEAEGGRARGGRDVVVRQAVDGGAVELECGVELEGPIEGPPAPIRCVRAPAGRALRAIHRGPEAERAAVHEALAAAARERGVDAAVAWEICEPAAGATEVYASLEPNAAQVAYWNGPAGDRWAATWELLDRTEAGITEAVLGLAAARAGERVLDVGCGAGSTTLALRERVGAGGAVTGIDISAQLLAVARARAAGTDITFVEGDASKQAFRPEHELVFSRFGVMFFAEPVSAFANILRAAAPGGRLAFVCWRTIDDNPWMTAPMAAARELVPGAVVPPPHVPGPFAFVDRERLHGILAGAGWREIAIERHDHAMILGGGLEEAVRASMMIGPLARATADVSPDLREGVRERLREALPAYAGPRGITLPASSWLVSARI